MADQLQIRGGDTASNSTFTGAQRELSIDTSKNQLIVHDGVTPGGHPIPSSDAPDFTGVATFDGDVIVYGDAQVNEEGVKIQTGLITTCGLNGQNSVFRAKTTAGGDASIDLSAAGRASFAGDLYVGTTWGGLAPSTTPPITLAATGTGTFALNGVFAGGVRAGAIGAASPTTGVLGTNIGETGTISATAAGANNVFVGREVGSAEITSSIGSTGSATFAGDVNAAGYVSGGSATSTYGLLGQANGAQAAVSGRQYDDGGFTWSGANSAGTITSSIGASGAATFAGDITSELNADYKSVIAANGSIALYGDGNLATYLNNDGSATFGGGNTEINSYGQFITTRTDSDSFPALTINSFGTTTGAINLYGTGAATFAGDVQSGGDPNLGVNTGIKLYAAQGSICATGNVAGQNLLLGYTQGTSTNTVAITAGGSATFANSTVGAYTYIANKPGTDAYCLSGGSSGDPASTWWQIKPNGDFHTLGAVTSSNITAFKTRMASAVASAADLSALKQAILAAVADL